MIVTGRSAIQLGGRRYGTFVVEETALDGTFRAIRQITVERPHRQLRAQHYGKAGGPAFTSEVTTVLQDLTCAPANWELQ